MEQGKERFFRNGKLEVGDSPIDPNCSSYNDALQSAGYKRLWYFGSSGHDGYGLRIDRCEDGERHVASIDYGDISDLIFIETFADYMEFMRQFGHLGTLAEAAETRFYVKDAYEFALDRNSGILRERVREVDTIRDAIEERRPFRSRPAKQAESEK